MSGNGPGRRRRGNLYVMTGNGSFDPDAKQFGSTFLKLSPGLTARWIGSLRTVGDLNLLISIVVPPRPVLMVPTNRRRRLEMGTSSCCSDPNRRTCNSITGRTTGSIRRSSSFRRLPLADYLPAAGFLPLQCRVPSHNHGSPVYWNKPVERPHDSTSGPKRNVRAYHYDERTRFKTKALKGMMGNKGMPGGSSVSGQRTGRRHSVGGNPLPRTMPGWKSCAAPLRAFDAQ
mgnify:CR=1 FL=1